MKRLILLLFSGMAIAQTFTVSGHVVNPNTGVPTGAQITFKLINTGTQQCKVSGTGLIVPNNQVFTPDGTGTISGTLYRNDFIVCGGASNTQWSYVITAPGVTMPTCALAAVTTTSLNVDSAACTNTVPVVTPPTGDTTYCRIDGSNCGFTGNVTFNSHNISGINNATITGALTAQSVNNVLWVGPGSGEYATCAAAVTAAGSVNKTIIAISSNYAGASCPLTVSENIIIQNYDGTREYCNGIGGSATPPCAAENYSYDDGNVFAIHRFEFTTNHQDLNGLSLGFYTLTYLKNATANGTSSIDGASFEANTSGTLSGTFQAVQGHEADNTLNSTGGTITDVRGGVFYTNINSGNTTAVTNVTGVKALGCNTNASAMKPTNCYGLEASDQTTGGVGKASGRNYSVVSRGISLLGFSTGLSRGGLDAEDHLNVTHKFLSFDGSDNTILQAISTAGILLEDSTTANQLIITSAGLGVPLRLFSNSAGVAGIGLGSNPFANLFLGTAATNNFGFTPASTTQAITVNIADPGTPTVNLALELKATSAAFATATTAGTCVQNVTAVTGAATTMAVSVSPVSTPGVGAQWSAFVSSAGNVTINECAVAASAGGTIAFNIRVFP